MSGRYEITEVPGGRFRIVEHTANGMTFHQKTFRSREEAQGRLAGLEATHRLHVAVAEVRKRARKRCECLGECQRGHLHRCHLLEGESGKVPGATVVLVVVSLNHDDDDVALGNLRAYCQLCRIYHDADATGEDGLFDIAEVDQ